MALSASLQLRQSQSLVMTPQLIQSIRLLQFTHLELLHFIEQEVERNPLLEIASAEGDDAHGAFDGGSAGGPETDGHGSEEFDWATEGVTAEGEAVSDRLDTSFDNVFPDDGIAMPAGSPDLMDSWKSMPGANGASSADGFDLDDFVAGATTLRDHVAGQISFAFPNAAERLIAADIADCLDEAGYLDLDEAELAARLGVSAEAVEAVILRLQEFDPPGLFARTLKECLAIQLRQRDRLDPAMHVLIDHLDLLARRDFQSLRRLCGVDDEDLLDMLAEIRALDPKPGLAFEAGRVETVVPDIIVRPSAAGGWTVELSAETLPRVLVNQRYHAEVTKHARNAADQAFLAECLQSASWLTRSLDQRARTIVKVATEIVRQQDAFLLHGVSHLRPLNLKAVADAIGMHESTVSRVTSNKYMMTPRGVFELKYFFTVSIASSEGGDAHSAEAVRQAIRRMIAGEPADAVLSDDDIVKALKADGIDIARRTVAKYRESLNIPSSVSRRRERRAMTRGLAS